MPFFHIKERMLFTGIEEGLKLANSRLSAVMITKFFMGD